MKRGLKRQLRQYYEPPAPEGKQAFVQAFFRKMYTPESRMGAQLLVQLRYIPASAWVVSIVLFILMLLSDWLLPGHCAGYAYSFVPFLGTVTVSVSMRCGRYRMAELEGTSLLSLGSMIMMRMVILGAGNLLLLTAWAFISEASVFSEFSDYMGKPVSEAFASTGASFFVSELLYILAPYMLAASGSLMVYRRCAQRDAGYMSLAVSGGVAALELSAVRGAAFLFEERYVGVWVIGCAALAALLAAEARKSIQTAAFCML